MSVVEPEFGAVLEGVNMTLVIVLCEDLLRGSALFDVMRVQQG